MDREGLKQRTLSRALFHCRVVVARIERRERSGKREREREREREGGGGRREEEPTNSLGRYIPPIGK